MRFLGFADGREKGGSKGGVGDAFWVCTVYNVC